MITGNKGEWSEVYALLKILSDKQLFAGDSKLQKLANVIYPVIQVIRNETNSNLEFSYDNSNVQIDIDNGNKYLIPVADFTNESISLLNSIKSSSSTTFSIPSTERFLNSFESTSIKAKSSVKSDIIIKIHDPRTGIEPTLGFSIKSELGGNSTLLNASKPTNFKFEVVGVSISNSDIQRINAIATQAKIQDRIAEIIRLGGRLELVEASHSNFNNNLVLIDSLLPSILGNAVLDYYSSSRKFITDITKELETKNPCSYDLTANHKFYEYKIKRLLMEIALGMMPNTVWTGNYDATGGYLVVKSSGDIVCYHIYNKNEFENYLFSNTGLETGSSSRLNFGSLYEEGSKSFMNLNTQIRFN